MFHSFDSISPEENQFNAQQKTEKKMTWRMRKALLFHSIYHAHVLNLEHFSSRI